MLDKLAFGMSSTRGRNRTQAVITHLDGAITLSSDDIQLNSAICLDSCHVRPTVIHIRRIH
jgi:hypothetical protein